MTDITKAARLAALLVPGAVFSTTYETGCTVAADPEWNQAGRFFTAFGPGSVQPLRFDIIDVTEVQPPQP